MKRNNLLFIEIPEFPDYFACSNGKIYSAKNNHISKNDKYKELTSFLVPGSKYLSVNLVRNKEKISFNVHKLIGWAFTGKSPFSYSFTHIRKNYLNNKPENLQYCKLEFTDEDINRMKELDLKEYEAIFKKVINYNYSSKIWKNYEVLKLKDDIKLQINFLKMYLKSKDVI